MFHGDPEFMEPTPTLSGICYVDDGHTTCTGCAEGALFPFDQKRLYAIFFVVMIKFWLSLWNFILS